MWFRLKVHRSPACCTRSEWHVLGQFATAVWLWHHLHLESSDWHSLHTTVPLSWCNTVKGLTPSCPIQDYNKLLSHFHDIRE
ncbi:hypothetical protein BDQ94DRAFT_142045 [Aspergillus welwitschiae]|uniref:Uncharacterized protein n=1 Tax=Aspergillus welwitschiae TaxID=1341132 RepID=A0A3F3Q596_9EURO|nr:hypothetical protein BDQ94DRAFT_142045 [Aspergillus welwitschiae]RDH34092.1 hypothetical protein BDQ94DRAFT_142045 [Aspergillus welwitschiae]